MIRASWSRLWRHRRLILVWWLAGLVTAFVAILPLRATLATVFGESLAEVELRSQLEVSHVVDLMSAAPGALPAIMAGLLGGLLVWLVLSSALSAGTLGVFCEGSSRPGFGASMTRWWGTFLRLEIVALLLVPVVAVAPILARVVVRVAGGETPPEPLDWWGRRIALLLAVVGFTLARLVVRFSRIAAVEHNHQRAWQAFRDGLRRLRRFWWQGLLLALAVALVTAVVVMAEGRLAAGLSGSAGAVLALFIGQQLLMLIRTTSRLWRTAAEVELVHGGADWEEGRGKRESANLPPEPVADAGALAPEEPEAVPQQFMEPEVQEQPTAIEEPSAAISSATPPAVVEEALQPALAEDGTPAATDVPDDTPDAQQSVPSRPDT